MKVIYGTILLRFCATVALRRGAPMLTACPNHSPTPPYHALGQTADRILPKQNVPYLVRRSDIHLIINNLHRHEKRSQFGTILLRFSL